MVYAGSCVGGMGTDVEDEGARVGEVGREGGGGDGGERLLGGERRGRGGDGEGGEWRGERGAWMAWGGVAGEETGSAEVGVAEAEGDGVGKVVVAVGLGGRRVGGASDGDIGEEIVRHQGYSTSPCPLDNPLPAFRTAT